MKKIVYTLCLIFITNAVHAAIQNDEIQKNSPVITITNTMNSPVIINLYVNNHTNAGSFGLLIQPNAQQTLEIPEFYWFEKQAIGGFRKPDQPSQVKVVDVLNHAYANTLDINVPNEEFYSFFIKPESVTIVIAPGTSAAKVTIEKVAP